MKLIIKPVIKSNICVRVHPIGCRENVKRQIDHVKKEGHFEGPKKALIVGGSSGYGLASRIALAFGAGTETVNVSFEIPPKGSSKTGTAGWWNNVYFQQFAKEAGLSCKDFVGDAFSKEMKDQVLTYLKEKVGKIDLLVYSLASNRRTDPKDGVTYSSVLKSIGEEVRGYTIDINNLSLKEEVMETATEDEIQSTIKVMGGEDWQWWVELLDEAGLLADGFKTIAYTYLGSEATYAIYSDGTIGQAKKHLEMSAEKMTKELKEKYDGEALISSSKAIVTKASIYIPIFPVYGAVLYKVMKEMGTHEGEIEQKYRLFKDMIYGDKRITDVKGRIRPDNLEMEEDVQEEVARLMATVNNDNIQEKTDIKGFVEDFLRINGFCFDTVDYEADVDLEELAKLPLE
ncbi:trans-2-enoyl-CoA reductase family protein [Alkalibacter rhizosphaerae]|uniref:Trans-2-enoyl-CoA reductase [NADH] n=1 Tax=Alkalibacter rhizosphaerae TaxID=2815577 RepID=A0A975AHN7_9FIRM|nr:enoyl-ACP reductase FabV [Alkalibacter rhizosphaerae]QSX07809.1 trans-2-enoyl-CoA reductase family protein [Alkalibacter rhizosphaerae]